MIFGISGTKGIVRHIDVSVKRGWTVPQFAHYPAHFLNNCAKMSNGKTCSVGAGCKASQFYSLPFRQAVGIMY